MWAIGADSPQALESFRDSFGIGIDILHDPGGRIYSNYQQQMPFPTGAFPQEVLVGRDGRIVYANNRFELESLTAAIEAALAEE